MNAQPKPSRYEEDLMVRCAWWAGRMAAIGVRVLLGALVCSVAIGVIVYLPWLVITVLSMVTLFLIGSAVMDVFNSWIKP